MPSDTRSMFDSGDWIAALDGDSIAYQPPASATLPRPALRPWQRYVITAAVIHTAGSILLGGMATAQGANAVTAWAVVAIALAVQIIADGIILTIAWRLGRL